MCLRQTVFLIASPQRLNTTFSGSGGLEIHPDMAGRGSPSSNCVIIFFFFSFLSIWDGTQSLIHARQVFYY